jgi:hypothetical protein
VPLHSNESYSIVACVFVAAGMCLPSCCVTMNVYFHFTISAVWHHVRILINGIGVFISLNRRTRRFCNLCGPYKMDCRIEDKNLMTHDANFAFKSNCFCIAGMTKMKQIFLHSKVILALMHII